MDDTGATMVEYALVVALVALVAAVTAAAIGPAVSDIFDAVLGWL